MIWKFEIRCCIFAHHLKSNAMKIKVGTVDAAHLERVRQNTIAKMQAYIAKNPKCSSLDMIFKKKITTMSFLYHNVVCTHCGHIEEKSTYCIAQKAQGYSITFNCKCGNSFLV